MSGEDFIQTYSQNKICDSWHQTSISPGYRQWRLSLSVCTQRESVDTNKIQKNICTNKFFFIKNPFKFSDKLKKSVQKKKLKIQESLENDYLNEFDKYDSRVMSDPVLTEADISYQFRFDINLFWKYFTILNIEIFFSNMTLQTDWAQSRPMLGQSLTLEIFQ